MSKLFVDELFDGVTFTQKFKVSRNVSIAHIRPWIFISGTLGDGDFQCRVLQGANELAVATIPYTDINAGKTLAYFHGYIRFDFDSLILFRNEGEEKTEYKVEFSMINHTNDPNNFLAMVRNWDISQGIVYGDVDLNGDPVNSLISPCGLEIFEYRSR